MEMSISLFFHVIAGSIAVFAGVIALSVKKGQQRHRQAGNIFFYSMSVMAIAGISISLLQDSMITILAGAFTVYLVLSSWTTVKYAPRSVQIFDYLYPVAAITAGLAGLYFGMKANNNSSGLFDGFPAEAYFFFSIPAVLAALFDIKMLINKGISGAHRIVRHLWRMCFAMFIAVGSFVDQGLKSVIPESFQNTWITALPANIIILITLFWLVRIYLAKKFKSNRDRKEQAA